jgi:DNA-binding Lrp family transcriptional regulator
MCESNSRKRGEVTQRKTIAPNPAPTLRRVRAREKAGVIGRYVALLDAERVGFAVRVK